MKKPFFVLVLILVSTLWLSRQPESVWSAPKNQRPTRLLDRPAAGDYRIFLPLISVPMNGDWTQEAHDAQRTGYTWIEPSEPWTFLWSWNGPDADGGIGNHFYDAPREARTVTGGNNIYVPAGAQGLYALTKSNGAQAWHLVNTFFNSTPAYDLKSGFVFAGGADGNLYKINSDLGSVAGTYSAGSPVNRAVLIAGSYAYIVTDSGQLHKVNITDMTRVWVYFAASNASTGLAYSALRDVIVFGTDDLYIHAVNNSDGSQKWRVKPSPNPAGFPNEYRFYWPMVAEQHGVVFLRMRLDHHAGLWGYPSAGNIWPNTNAEARIFLTNNPQYQNLFALNLDDGTKKFIPAVGYGGTEDLVNGSSFLTTGPVPVVKINSDGSEVVYIHFRNGQSSPPDGRWDSHMGEMVLDDSTIPGLTAGDLRFVKMSRFGAQGGNSYVYISDEQNPITMAGNTLFHSHWGASESVRITNRSNSLGLSFADPIQSVNRPSIVRAQLDCPNKNLVTHWTNCGLTYVSDGGRFWDGPGGWGYWNINDPPTPSNSSYSDGIRPRYSYTSGNLIIVEGNGGELLVFSHS